MKQGDRFALALGLENRPQIFDECKKAFRRMADRIFDFNLPLFQQTEAMETFVKEAIAGLPGYFSDEHANIKDRIQELQEYAVSYLQKSGKMTTNTNMSKKKKHPKSKTVPPPLPASTPNLRVIKVEHPKPKPLYRRNLKPEPSPPPPSPSPYPSSPSTSTDALATASTDVLATTTSDAVHKFLAACMPSMQHLAASFQAAGVSEGLHLVGIAKWDKEVQRDFIQHNLARNPMEVTAIVSGFAALL
ncbi:hypothetical protein B0H12DRAFT_1087579, partial [Mycena haematopus]